MLAVLVISDGTQQLRQEQCCCCFDAKVSTIIIGLVAMTAIALPVLKLFFQHKEEYIIISCQGITGPSGTPPKYTAPLPSFPAQTASG